MNGLYHGGQEGNTLWEKLINSTFNSMDGPQAVRNRAQYLKEKIAQTAMRCANQKTIRILSLACGPCEEDF